MITCPKFSVLFCLFASMIITVFFGYLSTNISIQTKAVSVTANLTGSTQKNITKTVSSSVSQTSLQNTYISEIWYQSPNFGDNCNFSSFKCTPDIWLEFYNPNSVELDISGYTISYFDYNCSVKNNICKPLIPVGTIVPANAYLVLRNKFGTLTSTTLPLYGILDRLGVGANNTHLFTSANGIVDYQKTKLGLEILNKDKNVIDTLSYSLPKNTNKEFRSLERCKSGNNFSITQSQNLLGTIEGYSLYATPNTSPKSCSSELPIQNNTTILPDPIIPVVPPTNIINTQPEAVVSPAFSLSQTAQTNSVITPINSPITNLINSNLTTDPIADLQPVLLPKLQEEVRTSTQEKLQPLSQTQPQTQNKIETQSQDQRLSQVTAIAQSTGVINLGQTQQNLTKTKDLEVDLEINLQNKEFINQNTISDIAYKPFIEDSFKTTNSTNPQNSNYFTKNLNRIYNGQPQNENLFQSKISNLTSNKSTIWHNPNTIQKISYLDNNNQMQIAEVDSFSFRASFIYFNVVIILFFVGKIYRNNIKSVLELLTSLQNIFNLIK